MYTGFFASLFSTNVHTHVAYSFAQLLNKARDKLADDEKIKTLQEVQKAEESCINDVEELLNTLGL